MKGMKGIGLIVGLGALLGSTGLAQEVETNRVEAVSSLLQDPFSMHPQGRAEFMAVSEAALPPGIHVVGILALKNGHRIGVLKIPGEQDVHFVSEGERIQVQQTTSKDPLYLLICSITNDAIEIAPRTRPEDVRIYR